MLIDITDLLRYRITPGVVCLTSGLHESLVAEARTEARELRKIELSIDGLTARLAVDTEDAFRDRLDELYAAWLSAVCLQLARRDQSSGDWMFWHEAVWSHFVARIVPPLEIAITLGSRPVVSALSIDALVFDLPQTPS